ncbi:MAG: TatD family hydrolase [Phycisphaerae bacterium]|nr:TatD family hydrolase [Phycisphaerae bacterium]
MLIDTHCHLTSKELAERLDLVVANAHDAGVTRMIQVAINPADARAALEIMAGRGELFLVAGIHPHEAGKCDRDDFAALAALLRGDGPAAGLHDRIVGLGETGLDFFYDFAPRKRQEKVFETQLELAAELDLPVVIHARAAEARVCEILADYPQLAGRAVFHCFSADTTIARRALDLGCFLSFTGVVTFKKSDTIRQSAQYVPSDRIMLETDAPYLSPEPVRKIRPNEPALLVHTARFVAELRAAEYAVFAAATTANAERFFRLTEG